MLLRVYSLQQERAQWVFSTTDTQTAKWFHNHSSMCSINIAFRRYLEISRYNSKRCTLISRTVKLWPMNSMATKWWICLPLDTWIFRELLSLNGVHCIHVTSHGQWVSMVSVGKFKGPLTYSQEIAFHPSPPGNPPQVLSCHSWVDSWCSCLPECSDSKSGWGGWRDTN